MRSATYTAIDCIWLTVSTILETLGLVGAYRVERRNRTELKEQKPRLEDRDRQSGVAGGCANILVVISVQNSTWPATG
jgi:hypothetical protein